MAPSSAPATTRGFDDPGRGHPPAAWPPSALAIAGVLLTAAIVVGAALFATGATVGVLTGGSLLSRGLRQLGIGYVGGALARDIPHPTGRVRAGDRAPDASAATPRAPWYGSTSSAARTARCWPSARVMRTSSCELHGRASRCRGPAGRVGGERDLVDVDGHAHRAYDLDGDALVLVRPDGYIGLLAGPAPRRRSTRIPRPAHRRGGSASLTPGGQPIHDCGWQVPQDCCCPAATTGAGRDDSGPPRRDAPSMRRGRADRRDERA